MKTAVASQIDPPNLLASRPDYRQNLLFTCRAVASPVFTFVCRNGRLVLTRTSGRSQASSWTFAYIRSFDSLLDLAAAFALDLPGFTMLLESDDESMFLSTNHWLSPELINETRATSNASNPSGIIEPMWASLSLIISEYLPLVR